MDVIIKAAGFVLIIIAGYLLKHFGVVQASDSKKLSFIIMTITLPCVLVGASTTMVLNALMLVPFAVGFCANVGLTIMGFLLSRKNPDGSKNSKLEQGVGSLKLAGYNIGAFGLPFVQAFFDSSQLLYIIMFDIGNCLFALGGSYAIGCAIAGKDDARSVKATLMIFAKTIPFDVYIATLILSALSIKIPAQILTITNIAADANPFLAMLMLGMMIDFNLDKGQIKRLFCLLLCRLVYNWAICAIVYFCLPVDYYIKAVIIIALNAPISILVPVYAQKIGTTSAETANVNSLSILASIVCMVTCMIVFA